MKQNSVKVVELKPGVGMWLTQTTLADGEERVFTDSVYTREGAEDDWTEWTDAQRAAWIENGGAKDEAQEGADDMRRARLAKRAEALQYYNEVGYAFTLNGLLLKLPHETRSKLRDRLDAEKASGLDTTAVWYGGQRFSMPIERASQLLTAIEVYASQCYDRYNQHVADIDALEDYDALVAYDEKEGYPQQLSL